MNNSNSYSDYMISDGDLESLQNEVIRIDDKIRNELNLSRDFRGNKLSSINDGDTDDTSIASDAMATLYTAISEKYNINASYKDFKSFIHGIVTESKMEGTINNALSSKVVSSLAKRTQLRLIISMAYLIERATNLIEEQSKIATVVTPELVTMIDRMGEWFAKMQEMIDTQSILDPDKTINRAIYNESRKSGSGIYNKDNIVSNNPTINNNQSSVVMNQYDQCSTDKIDSSDSSSKVMSNRVDNSNYGSNDMGNINEGGTDIRIIQMLLQSMNNN